jgi:hypothetical protein
MPVRFSDLLDTFEFVSASDFDENQAFLYKQTGETRTERSTSRSPTNRTSISAGLWSWTLQANSCRMTSRKFGTFSASLWKIQSLLARRGALDSWHAFEEKATERALRELCDLHSIEIAD